MIVYLCLVFDVCNSVLVCKVMFNNVSVQKSGSVNVVLIGVIQVVFVVFLLSSFSYLSRMSTAFFKIIAIFRSLSVLLSNMSL